MNSPIRVLIADDHSMFRSGLRAVVDSQADLDCVAEVGDGPAPRAATPPGGPDVGILDGPMAELDRLAAPPPPPPNSTVSAA
ncbi:response regulator transcription factor, partial [Nocardia abscessus]|uniref:response regulator transcription factor n=1 Tax=Nocardia abscessus TaxID=120957 RepID=UPI003CC7F3F5